jgi:hypothetical protein
LSSIPNIDIGLANGFNYHSKEIGGDLADTNLNDGVSNVSYKEDLGLHSGSQDSKLKIKHEHLQPNKDVESGLQEETE